MVADSGLTSTRIEAFSDGVFAIVITLLVLGIMLIPSAPPNLKCPCHKSVRGLKNRLKIPLLNGITTEPTSLPLLRLQVVQAKAKLSAFVKPLCFSLMM